MNASHGLQEGCLIEVKWLGVGARHLAIMLAAAPNKTLGLPGGWHRVTVQGETDIVADEWIRHICVREDDDQGI